MLQPHRTDSGLKIYRSPLLEKIGVPHAFSTRVGGMSPPPFNSLNLGLLGDSMLQDDLSNIHENYRHLRAVIGCEGRERCWVHQVHGVRVCTVRRRETFENGLKADALVTDDPERLISVKYADCVPVLLSTVDGRVVAAIHSGWRGVVAGVVAAAVQSMVDLAGVAPQTLVAAIGPCIGFEHFEVGPEVLESFVSLFGEDAPLRRVNEKGFVDLQEAVRRQLMMAGLAEDQIDGNDRCTFRDRDEFFSHRREAGITGRMAGLIGPRSEPTFTLAR